MHSRHIQTQRDSNTNNNIYISKRWVWIMMACASTSANVYSSTGAVVPGVYASLLYPCNAVLFQYTLYEITTKAFKSHLWRHESTKRMVIHIPTTRHNPTDQPNITLLRSVVCQMSWSEACLLVFFSPLDWLAIATQQQLMESIVCMYFIFIFSFSGGFLCFKFLYRSFPLIILPFCQHFGSFGLLFSPILSLYIASIEHQIYYRLLFSPI